MLKNYRKFLTAGVLAFGLAACGDDVTITEPAPPPPPPETPNIVSFSVAPTNATIAVGQTVQASYNLQTKAGVAGTVAFASGNAAVASVDPATGLITAVSNGTALISATATAGGQTATAQIGITVRELQPAQISIQSVTQFANTVPVPLNNVNGQIEVNMNFNPGEQTVDSVNVFIGSKRAAKQAFATNPAAGIISLSINTANFVKNTTTGVATVDYQNGASTISAAVYPRGGAATATNTIAVVLNNQDGWAADMSAPSAFANNGAGLTYWGGPTAGGLTTATVYPVIYTPGRSIQTVSFAVAGCANSVDTSLPFRASFGYGAAGADVNCGGSGGYEYTGGTRDNVAVTNAIDNTNNPFPLTPLIANVIVPGSTPDSLRFDWRSPSVSTPDITRSAPAVTGWVNASFSFINFGSTDNGVGLRATRDRAVSYTAPNCGGGAAVPMPSGTGADIPECASNFIGGAVGLGGTAPYRVSGTESDRLANVGASGNTQHFGVDKTNPQIRWGLEQAAPALVASLGPAATDTLPTGSDSLFITKPVAGTDVWRAEYLDDRAGFLNNTSGSASAITSQIHSLSTAGHVNPTGACVVAISGGPGAAFVTSQACSMRNISAIGPVRLDGWRAGMQVDVPQPEGYYGYRTQVRDAAGNSSITIAIRALVNAEDPFATGLGLPAQLTNAAFPFNVTAADSAEVINISLALEYQGLPTTDFLRYSQEAVGVVFDNAITSPLNQTVSPTYGAPFVRHLEVVNANLFPTGNINGAATINKPVSVQAFSFNPANTSAASSVIAIPALNVQNGQTIAAFNTANPTIAVNHWRIIPTLANSNQFGSTTPLRAQASSPTNSPNPPFVRVDFYRLDAGGTWHNYLGSVAGTSAIGSDQGTYRSWVYALPAASFVSAWDGADQAAVAGGETVAAVGVTANGDAVLTFYAFP